MCLIAQCASFFAVGIKTTFLIHVTIIILKLELTLFLLGGGQFDPPPCSFFYITILYNYYHITGFCDEKFNFCKFANFLADSKSRAKELSNESRDTKYQTDF